MKEIQSLDKKKYRCRLIQIYMYVMFGIYPLVYHNFYYDIVTCKYIFFLAFTGILLILLIFSMPDDFFSGLNLKNNLNNIKFRVCDYFVIGFFVSNVISVILSDNKIYALSGADGRNMGLLTVFAICVLYFVISRNYVESSEFYYVLCIGSICVSMLGIMNFLNIDILGFYKGLTYEQKLNYISTLGHIDVYTSYFSISIPILYIVYLTTHSKRLKIMSFISLVINICGLVAGQCDSGYIIMLVSFVLAIVLIKGRQRYSVYLFPIAVSAIIIKVMFFINNKQAEKRELSRFAEYVYSDYVCIFIILLFIICVLIERDKIIDMSGVWKLVLEMSISGIIIYIAAVFIFTMILKDVSLGSMEGVLRFNDSFGSYRGYIWKLLIKDYKDMNICEKIFGIGTDTMRPYLVQKYGNSMYVVTNAYYDNAHNELIQYLITTGITGLIMYIGFVVCSVKGCIKCSKKCSINGSINCSIEEKNAYRIIFLAAVLCYIIQSFVNINQVVTTPLFLILLSCINKE